MQAKTQKAKGILGLAAHPPSTFSTQYVKKVRVFPHDPLEQFPFFARPCPMKPRHGFVESRIIENLEQWNALVKEVEASNEPEAEIIMMPYIQCQFSGVVTESGISYGPGNDGVTGGQHARSVPAESPSTDKLYQVFGMASAASAAGITESPYLEFVESNGKLEAVQLRNGPAVALTKTYVPTSLVVEEVVVPTESEKKYLLEWEKRMKELKGRSGIVVHYPGGSMHSHVAVQAIEQTKHTTSPFAVWLLDEAPVVGQTLEPSNTVAPMTSEQLQELAAMIGSAVTALSIDRETDQSEAIHLAVAALHASPMWTGERHLLTLRAFAVAAMLRFAGAAILGELRHWHSRGPGRSKLIPRTTPLDEDDRLGRLSRDQVYARAFKLHIRLLSPRIGCALRDFKTKGWSGSFGGKNWANCTEQTVNLYNAVSAFMKTPTIEAWAEVMSAWNSTVNVFHNTGKFLNKFISSAIMDQLAKAPVLGLASSMVGRLTVHDEDFPLHRNPARVAEELVVVVPKGPAKPQAPKVDVVPVNPSTVVFEARWRLKSPGLLYVQVKLPMQYGKEYGTSFTAVLTTLKARQAMAACTLDGQSLAGTNTPYGIGTVRQIGGRWTLVVTQNNLWVALPNDQMEKALQSQGAQDDDDNN